MNVPYWIKKWICLLMSMLMCGTLTPVIIEKEDAVYVDGEYGSDSSDGTCGTPVKTFGRALEMLTDDKKEIFVIRGSFRETVNVDTDGVTITGAENSAAVITGLEKAEGKWEKYKCGIYRTRVEEPVSCVYVDGEQMNPARWPNTPWTGLCRMKRAETDKGTGQNTVVDKALPAGIDMTGAMLTIWPGGEWTVFSRKITSCEKGRSISWDVPVRSATDDNPEGADYYVPKQGNPYYVYGLLSLLDTAGEWYYDDAEKMLYLYAPGGGDPGKREVSYKKRNIGLKITADNVTVTNVGVFGCGVECTGEGCVLDGVDVKYADFFTDANYFDQGSHICTRLDGKNNVWKNSEISDTYGNGIALFGENNAVVNCRIYDVCHAGGYYSCISEAGTDCRIENCTLHTSGRYLVQHNGKGLKLLGCELYDSSLLTKDCGATYTWGTDGAGTEIAGNLYRDNREVAVYLDNNCKNYYVHDNLIVNNGTGITLNSQALNDRIENNIFLRNEKTSSTYCYEKDEPSMKNTVIRGNVYTGSWQLVGGDNAPEFENNRQVKTVIGVSIPHRQYGCTD